MSYIITIIILTITCIVYVLLPILLAGFKRYKLSALTITIILCTLPAILYLQLGSPFMQDYSIYDDPEALEIVKLINLAEATIVSNPENSKGWETLGPIYQRLGEYQKAIQAYRNVRLLRTKPSLLINLQLAQLLMNTSDGAQIPFEAQKIINNTYKTFPNNNLAKYYQALVWIQEKNINKAKQTLKALQNNVSNSKSFSNLINQALIFIKTQEQNILPKGNIPNIEQMVANLYQKLQIKPDNLKGWRQLLNSYKVLNQPKKFQKALDEAIQFYININNPNSAKELKLIANSLWPSQFDKTKLN